MNTAKKIHHKKFWIFFIAIIVVVSLIAGGAYYHHYEYAPLSFSFSDGSGMTISRHNLNMMTPQERDAIFHPVNRGALHPCDGNVVDQCIDYPAIDFWPSGSEGASNPELDYNTGSPKEIMGRIVSDNGPNLQIKTTSGRVFTIIYPIDTVANFNANLSSNYRTTVTAGDEIFVAYHGSASDHGTTIKTPQINHSSLIIKNQGKQIDGPIIKY